MRPVIHVQPPQCDCQTKFPSYPVFRNTYHVPGCRFYEGKAPEAPDETTPKATSPTPRTDAAEIIRDRINKDSVGFDRVVTSDFARQLERERDQTSAALERIEKLAIEVRAAARHLPLEVRRKISTIANIAHTAKSPAAETCPKHHATTITINGLEQTAWGGVSYDEIARFANMRPEDGPKITYFHEEAEGVLTRNGSVQARPGMSFTCVIANKS